MTPRISLSTLVATLALVVTATVAGTPAGASPAPDRQHSRPAAVAPARATKPAVGHVFIVNIENEGADDTYGPGSPAPYLANKLRAKGVFVQNYYGIAHNSLPNYIAQISGQAPNPSTQADCPTFASFNQIGFATPGQAVGTGCVYPERVGSLPVQLDTVHATWKGYMEGMGTTCEHPTLNTPDGSQTARPDHMYATRHDPFMYFAAVIDHSDYCARHVVPLDALTRDLEKLKRTPNLSYLTPDLCNDGHDAPCADGRPGGLTSVDAWMRTWIPKILHSRAYKKDGVLIITADEAETDDATACCGEVPGPNSPVPGIFGPGGGRVGALVLSRFAKPGSATTKPYNHYSLLAWLEDTFDVGRLGFATDAVPFGHDVFKRPSA